MNTSEATAPKHSLGEDVFAIFTGTLFISFGLVLFKKAGLLTGGTSGIAFLAYYLAAVPFGLAFFVINLPFYILAMIRVGWRFTVKTFCAVALVSVMVETHLEGLRPTAEALLIRASRILRQWGLDFSVARLSSE